MTNSRGEGPTDAELSVRLECSQEKLRVRLLPWAAGVAVAARETRREELNTVFFRVKHPGSFSRRLLTVVTPDVVHIFL